MVDLTLSIQYNTGVYSELVIQFSNVEQIEEHMKYIHATEMLLFSNKYSSGDIIRKLCTRLLEVHGSMADSQGTLVCSVSVRVDVVP
jgi:hypothetical protein